MLKVVNGTKVDEFSEATVVKPTDERPSNVVTWYPVYFFLSQVVPSECMSELFAATMLAAIFKCVLGTFSNTQW